MGPMRPGEVGRRPPTMSRSCRTVPLGWLWTPKRPSSGGGRSTSKRVAQVERSPPTRAAGRRDLPAAPGDAGRDQGGAEQVELTSMMGRSVAYWTKPTVPWAKLWTPSRPRPRGRPCPAASRAKNSPTVSPTNRNTRSAWSWLAVRGPGRCARSPRRQRAGRAGDDGAEVDHVPEAAAKVAHASFVTLSSRAGASGASTQQQPARRARSAPASRAGGTRRPTGSRSVRTVKPLIIRLARGRPRRGP